MAQVIDQRCSGSLWQRQPFHPAAFALRKAHCPLPPVNIIQMQNGDFLAAQPQIRQTMGHGIIAPANGGTAIKGGPETFQFHLAQAG